ncbi:transglutaminase domain-containing protein [Ruminiclostridium cellobioparum]|uniref:transglutaminase domain-containing protein n=2 Tax=Ruminiclostridium cellobioparum TaxID=29355 RepID=UPI000487C310|nr:transglutaminase domain-containing protein [Ruminiclostridium cellobioparum]
MKKLSAIVIVLIVTLLTGFSTSLSASAESYFSNNKALDGIYAKLEKEFLKYKKDEVIPLKNLGAIITEENQTRWERTSKKISDSQVKAAAQVALNNIKVAVELKEEELGGLSSQEYKVISDYLDQQIFFAKGSEYGWDFEGEKVQLYTEMRNFNEWLMFRDMEGNFGRMGKEKDEVNPADLKVRNKIVRYLNQSIQKGNKVSPRILEELPEAVEELFIERNLSRIMAGRMLSEIHKDIYTPDDKDPDADHYDGTKSVEEIIESYGYLISNRQGYRDDEKVIEYYEYPEDKPSAKAWNTVTKGLLNGDLSETFKYGFNKAITLDQLANLYFGTREPDEKIVIDDSSVAANSPDYIKLAYIYGMIDDTKNLEKPLTRLEATRSLVKNAIYKSWSDSLKIIDCNQIPLEDQINVASCLNAGMKTRTAKFEPLSSYTKEEAIVDRNLLSFNKLRGFNIPLDLSSPSKIIVGKNTINLLFGDKKETQEYFEDCFEDTVLDKVKLNGNYTKIDTGGVLIEIFTPENGIKFTIKNGTTYLDLDKGKYGPRLGYRIEPKIIKSNEKVDMNMQLDSITKKLYTKLDAILAKIIKPGMTQEQKVKAIHDFVVRHVTYDSKLQDEQTVESVIETIDKGRGVCGDYSLLFMHLCRRVSIPCTFEIGDPFTLNHAWNSVFVNGQWLFVDTTWDDNDSGKILYTYYLKDRFTFMKDHTPWMGVPEVGYYSDADLDPMSLKNQDEIRAYLLKNFYWTDGYKLTFRVSDKNIKPTVGYLNDPYVSISLTYDAKNNLYTVTAKSKK